MLKNEKGLEVKLIAAIVIMFVLLAIVAYFIVKRFSPAITNSVGGILKHLGV